MAKKKPTAPLFSHEQQKEGNILLPGEKEAERKHGSFGIATTFLHQLADSLEEYAIIMTNSEGLIENWNRGAQDLFFYTEEEIVGQPLSILYPAKGHAAGPALAESALAAGQVVKKETIFLRKDHSLIKAKCTLFPMKDETGLLRGYSLVAKEERVEEQALNQENFINKVDQVVTSSLDYQIIIASLIQLCVPAIADWVYIDMVQQDGSSKRAHVAHADPNKKELARLTQQYSPSFNALQYPQARALFSRKSVLIAKVTDTIIEKAAVNKEHEKIMKAIQANSLIAVPMIAREKTLGILTFIIGESGRWYTEKDLKLAEEIAWRTALVLENARLFEQAKLEKERLNQVFTEAPMGIAILKGSEYRVELANMPICKIWNKAPEALLHQPIFEALPETKDQGFKKLLDEVMSCGEPYIGKEVPLELQREGIKERMFLNFVYQPMRDLDGKVSGIMVVATNVSDQVNARKSIEKSEESLRIALEAGEMGTWHLDLLNNTFTRSLQHDQVFGYQSLQEHWGFDTFSEHILPEDRAIVQERFKEAEKSGNLLFETRIRRLDGALRWISVQGQVFYISEKPVRMAGVVTDVTERIQIRQKAEENARRFRLLLETIPQITWTLQADGTANFFNERWHNYTGISLQQSQNVGWISALHPDDVKHSRRVVQKAIKDGTSFTLESRFKHKADGMYRWHLCRTLPVKNEKGEITLWVGTATDIHDQKMQSTLLEMQNKKLEGLNNYLDNFVHTVAHDLRAPVANLKGLLQLLDFKQNKKKQEEIIERLHSSVERLDNTLQGMIQLIEVQSSSDTLSQKLLPKQVFEKVVEESLERLEKIDYEINATIPEHCSVLFIKAYLESIFRNLLSNSIKYRKLNESLLIEVDCQEQKEYTLIRFRDNGIGIDLKKHRKNLFKPFVRFTSQAYGKGIGLHIINDMVRRQGGKVEIESQPGKGTTFYLYLKK